MQYLLTLKTWVSFALAKTNGNPFFLIQFLNSLADQGLIEFDTNALKWEWDAA